MQEVEAITKGEAHLNKTQENKRKKTTEKTKSTI